MSRHHDDTLLGIDLLNLIQQVQSGLPLHHEVGQDQVELTLFQQRKRFADAGRFCQFMPLFLEGQDDNLTLKFLVVNNEYPAFHDSHEPSSCCPRWSGSTTVKVVPSPGLLSTRISPPCSLMIRFSIISQVIARAKFG